MRLRFIATFFLLNNIVIFSQENITKHTIIKGETVSSIAKKYDVNQSAIFKLNPNSKNLLKLNSILLIPVAAVKKEDAKSKIAANYASKEHQVLAKETSYGIAKQYGISLKELNDLNPILVASGLKIGQKILIPAKTSSMQVAISSQAKNLSQKTEFLLAPQVIETEKLTTEQTTIEVLAKESKYSIARKYGITVKELDKANPTLGIKPLRVGQKITIPGNGMPVIEIVIVPQQYEELLAEEALAVGESSNVVPKIEDIVPSEPKIKLPKLEGSAVPDLNKSLSASLNEIVRQVLPKETKYGIAKEYGISVQELEIQNPEIKKRLRVGDRLTIYTKNATIENNSISNANNLTTTANIKIDLDKALNPTLGNDILDQLIERASENIGTRYRSGGTSKTGFDCSGLMCITFGAFDIKLPRTSREQSDIGTKINAEEAQKGDLIFFKTNGRSQINHVGMVVEVCEGEIKFIHSSVSNGVIISSTKEKYYEKNFSQINRVLQ